MYCIITLLQSKVMMTQPPACHSIWLHVCVQSLQPLSTPSASQLRRTSEPHRTHLNDQALQRTCKPRLLLAEATQHRRPSQQPAADQPQPSTCSQQQPASASPQQGRSQHTRPVALETPKDQYNRHLEAARSKSGSLTHTHSSPRHASPTHGEAVICTCGVFTLLSCSCHRSQLLWCQVLVLVVLLKVSQQACCAMTV